MVDAVAKHSFKATSEDELSFEKGDTIVVNVLENSEQHWYKASLNGKRGLVPANYIEIKPYPFLHGNISRDGAVWKLNDQPDGAFLIRRSESDISEISYSLSVKYGDGVQHFKILTDGSFKYFLWVVKFRSLNELVEYYKTSSVSRTQTILLKDMEVECEVAVAEFDFTAQEDGEMTFRKGDHIEILQKADADWWKGKLKGREERGLFPASYVKIIK
ncbi:growth factor receptor-bound protein 2-like [Asterias amurensis]|uniref:growth factor receptor-bound protein 2-like n=1 Tax=Asterias amurensis TaxID=7602 RepID=UPI003AB22F18